MAIDHWHELKESRSFSVTSKGATETLRFIAFYSYDQNEVFQYARANTSVLHDNLLRADIRAEHFGGGVWQVEVPYGVPEGGSAPGGGGTAAGATAVTPTAPAGAAALDPAVQGVEVQFETSGGTEHITQSIQTRSKTKRGGGTARDFKGAINVTRDGVLGVDRVKSRFEFGLTVQRQTVSMDYIRTLRSLVATWNDDTFWGFEAGEVLYLGCTGKTAERGKWICSHRFAAGENLVDVEVCEDLTIPAVDAWDYVWFTYADSESAEGFLQLPEEAYVEQIYYPGTFSGLQVG